MMMPYGIIRGESLYRFPPEGKEKNYALSGGFFV